MPNGPSHFVDVSGVTYGSQAIYSVSNIRIQRNVTQVKGKNNNVNRFVSSHTVFFDEKITFDFEDINALESLMTAADTTTMANLVFTWIASAQQLTGSPLPNQTVTVKNVVIERVNTDAESKALGKGSFEGTILGVSDDTDPVVFSS